MSAGRYTDNARGGDPFADNAGNGYNPGGQDYNYTHGNGPSNDIALSSSYQGASTARGYSGLPHNESESDLSAPNRSSYTGLPAGAGLGAGSFQGGGMQGYSNIGKPYGSSGALDGSPSPWLQQQQKREKRSKWMIWGSVLAVIGLVIIGVVVGVVVSRNNSKSSSSSSSSSSAGIVNQTDPNDPSTFVKDPNLHQAFYGLAYTPEGSQLPSCGNKLADVITDIQLMSQLTKRIRLYGADCNQTALVLEAIKQTKVDMQVWLGNYPIPTDGGAAYVRQRDILKLALQTYGADHIGGMTVGNEFMLNYLGANGGGDDPNGSIGNTGADLLISNITDSRNMVTALNLGKTIPIGNSDAGSYFNTKVLEAVDYGMANVHPWFANTTIQAAAGWTADFFQNVDVAAASNLTNKPQMYIAETGWPTESSDAGNANNGASTASVANLQIFLDTFVCQANANGTGYFFFEYFDEPWKDAQFGGVEGWWGLFTSDRKLKNITIPTCTAP